MLDPPELVGAGSRLVVDEPLLAHVPVHLVGHDLLRVHDEPPGKEGSERCERPVEGEDDGVCVRRPDVLRLEERVQHPRRPLAELQGSLERPAHRLRVHRIAVVELGVLDQVEGVGEAVLAHVVAFGEPWDHPRGRIDVLHQRVVHRLLHGADRGVVLDARVHDRHRLTLHGDQDLLVAAALERLRGRGEHRARGGPRRHDRRRKGIPDTSSHVVSSRFFSGWPLQGGPSGPILAGSVSGPGAFPAPGLPPADPRPALDAVPGGPARPLRSRGMCAVGFSLGTPLANALGHGVLGTRAWTYPGASRNSANAVRSRDEPRRTSSFSQCFRQLGRNVPYRHGLHGAAPRR